MKQKKANKRSDINFLNLRYDNNKNLKVNTRIKTRKKDNEYNNIMKELEIKRF